MPIAPVNIEVRPGEILGGIGKLILDIRTAITGVDPVAKAQIEARLVELEAAASNAQAQINMAEATNPNVFVSGWRPFIGWTCGGGLFVQFIISPFFAWAAGYLVILGYKAPPPLPAINFEYLMGIVIPMLGLGWYRTYERVKGVQRN